MAAREKTGVGERQSVQTELPLAEPRPGRGGKRPNAGRKVVHRLPSGKPLHRRVRKRLPVTSRDAVHVVLRVADVVGTLRRSRAYHAIRLAMRAPSVRRLIRIVHVSIQRQHIHLLVEAAHELDLARGIQGLEISATRRLNAAVTVEQRRSTPRRGQVFVTRYHAEIIKTPRQARHALAYVLNNWRRHREDLAGAAQRRTAIDPYASGGAFDGWRDAPARPGFPSDYQPLPVSAPRSWLLRVGWRRHGAIGVRDVPGRMTDPATGARRPTGPAGAGRRSGRRS